MDFVGLYLLLTENKLDYLKVQNKKNLIQDVEYPTMWDWLL